MIHNMVGGGGQGEGSVEAGTIVVTYPTGATCTVTGNGQTYAALDTSGAAAFIVEPGTWTVTAVQGTNSDSQSVTVTAGGWVEVELSFALWLYKNGDKCVNTTGGWNGYAMSFSAANFGTVPSVQEFADYTKIYFSTIYKSGAYRTVDKVDLTGYSALIFNGDNLINRTNNNNYLKMCVWSNMGSNTENNLVANAATSAGQTLNYLEIDISALSGEYYVGFALYSFETSVEIDLGELFAIKGGTA